MATFHPSGCHRSFASRMIDAVCLIVMVVLSLSLSLSLLSFQSVLSSICSYMTVCISRVWTKCSQLLLEQENVKKRMRMPIGPVLLEAQVRAADRDNDTWWELTFVKGEEQNHCMI